MSFLLLLAHGSMQALEPSENTATEEVSAVVTSPMGLCSRYSAWILDVMRSAGLRSDPTKGREAATGRTGRVLRERPEVVLDQFGLWRGRSEAAAAPQLRRA